MPQQPAQTFIPLTDPALQVFVPTTQTISQSPYEAAATVNITQIDQRSTQTYKINNPGGAATQVQVNVDGKFVGDSGMTFNTETDSLAITGAVTAGSIFTDTLKYANGTTWAFPGTFSTANVASYLPTYSGSVAALTVVGQTTLGAVANVHITGGTTAQVLSTDGAGNLSWATASGGGSGAVAVAITKTGDLPREVAASTFSGVTSTIGAVGTPYTCGISQLYCNGTFGSVAALSTLTALSFDNLQSVGIDLEVRYHPRLTTLALPELLFVGDDTYITDNPLLTTLNVPKLQYSYFLGVQNNAALGTLSFPALLASPRQLSIQNNAVMISLSAPLLRNVGAVGVYANPSLATVNLNSLVRCDGTFNLYATVATSLSFPALDTVVGSMDLQNPAALTSFSASALQHVLESFTLSGIALTVVDIGNLKSLGSTFIVNSTTVLPPALVDSLLVKLASMDGTAGTTAYSGQFITLQGTPTATGLTAKATLEGRGCTVTVNV